MWAEALKVFRAAAEADPKMSAAWYCISAAEREMNGGEPCDAEYVPLARCIKLDPSRQRRATTTRTEYVLYPRARSSCFYTASGNTRRDMRNCFKSSSTPVCA